MSFFSRGPKRRALRTAAAFLALLAVVGLAMDYVAFRFYLSAL